MTVLLRAPRPGPRVRVLVHVHDLGLGGTQLNALDFAVATEPFGVDSLVVGPAESLPAGPSLLDVAARRGVEVVAYDAPLRLVRRARALSGMAASFGADVVHSYSSWGYRPTYWGPALLGRRPLVQTIYEMAVDPGNYTRTPLIVGTGYLVDDLADRRGPVSLVSPPVDLDRDTPGAVDTTEFVRALDVPDGSTRVVMVSRLDGAMKLSSVLAAIDAIQLLGRDDVVLVIVGGGDAEGAVRQRASAVNDGLGRRAVVLTGALADPRPAYAAADISVGMGGSAARALAFGSPLVAQGEHGWSDVFRPETARDIFRRSFWSDEVVECPQDLLADKLRLLLDDPSSRSRLAEFGRDFAVAHFGLEAMAERLAGVYRSAVAQYGATDWMAELGSEFGVLRGRVSSRLRPANAPRV